MKKSRSLTIILTLIVLVLGASCDRISSAFVPAPVEAASHPINQVALLRTPSDATIEFRTQNGQMVDNFPSETQRIPHLVLHRNGILTSPEERTLFVELTSIEIPADGMTVTLVVETQHNDPDVGDDSDSPILVWRESKWMPNITGDIETAVTTSFMHTFEYSVTTGINIIKTPTDYFRIEISAIEPGNSVPHDLYVQDYAFLMEDQVVAPLPQVGESAKGAAPDELVVYYCDMFPMQIRTADGISQFVRAEVPDIVQMQLIPHMVEIFRIQSDDWGFLWHEAWTSYRSGENAEKISAALSEGQTWFHGRAPTGGHAGIALNTRDNLGSDRYDSLTDRLLSKYQHELFHNIQRNLIQYYSGIGDIAGKEGSWSFFSEGTAVLASTVGDKYTEFSSILLQGSYYINANKFIGGHGLSGNLNSSYAEMDSYSTAIYWRFIYEQCGGMQVIHQALETLYSGKIVNINETTEIASWLPVILDQTLANASCPFTTYRDSLNAFASALYALHVDQGRCTALDEPGFCGLYDPNHMYRRPTTDKISYSGELVQYGAAEQARPAGIPASFGMDFIEIDLGPETDGQPLTLEVYGEADTAATFDVQVWGLRVAGEKVIPASESVNLTKQVDGHLVYTIPTIDRNNVNRLAVIITRVDAQEVADSLGAYTLVLRPGVE